MNNEALRPELDRTVKLIFTNARFFEEDNRERIGQAVFDLAGIVPDDGRVDFRIIFKPVDRIGPT